LLRYNLSTKTAQVIPVDEIVFSILRAGDALYLGSSNGVYVLRDGKPTHYVLEPTPDGGYGIY
jgi:hypothetical protein